MRRTGIALVLLVIIAALVSADIQDVLDTVDQHHEAEEYQRSRSLIESSLSGAISDAERAELYWRLARAWLNLGDEAEDSGVAEDELLVYFERGEAEAQKGIDADPDNHLGYYWKSANIGRWGQVKGILNSLAKAKPMRDLLQQAVTVEPEHADSYYVLGQLFQQVPGFPLSFGDPDYAVSLGRKSLDLHERQIEEGVEEQINYDYYTEMARHLWDRNWSAARRAREQARKQSKYRSISDPMEKNFYYEAEVTLRDVSDREEALELITWVVRRLEGLSDRTDSQNDDLEEAREFLASWQ